MPSFLSPRLCVTLFVALLAGGLAAVAALIGGGSIWVWGPVAALAAVGAWGFAILAAFGRARR
jgi:hypothetical protein